MDSKNRIKVLRIIGECKTGGTETIAMNYYQHINHQKIGMDFMFYGKSLPRFNEVLEAHGDNVINVIDYTKNLLGSIQQIKQKVQEGHYDIVHAQLNALNFFPLLGAKLGGARIRIAANHSTANLRYEFKKSIIKYILRPTASWMATHYAACSESAGSWCFGKCALKNNKIHIIRNAIDLEKFTFSKEIRRNVRYQFQWNGKFVIGHAGRFTEQKNHKFIIDVFSEIHKKCPEALLVLIGDGQLRESISNKVMQVGLGDCVQFLGVRFDINELMQGMDLFLFPSLYEGLGNVITEAQAVGLQCICSDAVPNEVKLTNLVEFLPLKECASEWANYILTYQKGYEHRSRHEELIQAGYEIESAAHELEKYYQNLIRGKT